MDVKARKGDPLKQKTPCLVVGAFEGKTATALLKEIDTALDGSLSRAVKEKEFSGRQGETLLFHPGKRLAAERILVVGLGREKGMSLERLRQAAGTAAGTLRGKKIHRLVTDLATVPLRPKASLAARCRAVAEGLKLASYRFDRYRTENSREDGETVREGFLLVEKQSQLAEAEEGIRQAAGVVRGVILARDLVNEPGNVKSPEYLADQARVIAGETGMTCTILDREALAGEGCGAILGVAQGSIREPRLIVLEYRGGSTAAKPIALVGKGVVFDAGGISLKPADKMDEMKSDMGGGAAVLGTLLAAALLKLPVNLVGLVPAVENLPSGSAIRPGDILTSLAGKTIEVLNTDAEGRLILADALTYAKRFDPRVVIDLATLTGACVIALGHHAAAILGNHDGLIKALIQAGEETGERLWQLPLWEEYAHQIKSEIADMKNIGGRPGGTITAAAFLQKFADDFTWAHLDIAGTALEEKGRPYVPKGASGFGVRLLLRYLEQSAPAGTGN